MNHSDNQRCGFPCRPQMQVPPCANTDCGCGCESAFSPPLRPVSSPSTQAPVFPRQPSMTYPASSVSGGANSGNCGCTSSGSVRPGVRPGGIRPGEELQQMPIGMGYVPWQKWGQTYSMEQGLSRGTIFPDLDFPFVMGRCR